MARIEVLKLAVHFGDCDPVGIAYFPNFYRWYDASSRNYFDRCGIPPWRETEKLNGIIGTPLLEVSSRFIKPVSYGDRIEVHTSIVQWDTKVFVHRHEILCEGELIAESTEKRVFVRRDVDTGRMHAIPVPADVRAKCE